MGEPDRPSPGHLREAWNLVVAAITRVSDHRLTDRSAALTYYAMLSIFPALIVMVSLLGLLGHSITGSMISNFEELTPGPVRDTMIAAIAAIERKDTAAGAVLVFSLSATLYTASSYVGAMIRASNSVWQVRERRRFYKTIPLRIGITLLMLTLLVALALVVVMTGPVVGELRTVFGLGEGGSWTWELVRWPLMISLMAALLALLYNLAPSVDDRGFRPITAGSVLAVALWLLSSAGFTAYLAAFDSYNKTYGSLTGIIIFLVWLWLSNLAILLGMELDAELARYRRKYGHSPFRVRRQRRRNQPDD